MVYKYSEVVGPLLPEDTGMLSYLIASLASLDIVLGEVDR